VELSGFEPLTYSMRSSQRGRLWSLAALPGRDNRRSGCWNRWRLVVRVESTADGWRVRCEAAVEGDVAEDLLDEG
jgi:hypothetical protein